MSGETESNVSGWTVDTLHRHLAGLAEERNTRYQQRFEAQSEALKAAFVAADLAVNTAMTAAEKAVAKAEAAAERRFESVNEFRAQLADQASSFMPRTEAEQRITAMSEKIDLLRDFAASSGGRSAGLSAGWSYLAGALGLLVGMVGLILSLSARAG
jgi:hypothetical protein